MYQTQFSRYELDVNKSVSNCKKKNRPCDEVGHDVMSHIQLQAAFSLNVIAWGHSIFYSCALMSTRRPYCLSFTISGFLQQNTSLPSALLQMSHKLTFHWLWAPTPTPPPHPDMRVMNQSLSQTTRWCCAKYSTWPTEGCEIRIDLCTRQNSPAVTNCVWACASAVCWRIKTSSRVLAVTFFSHGSICWYRSPRI